MGLTFGRAVRIISCGVVLALAPRIDVAAQTSSGARNSGPALAVHSRQVRAAANAPQRNAQGKYRIMYAFKGGTGDGAYPVAALTEVAGSLYGTTYSGGPNMGPDGHPDGAGTVFKIGPSGNESVLHTFGLGFDGAYPRAALTNVNGVLYGTTYAGGSANFVVEHSRAGGTVFALDTTTGIERVLHSFPNRDGDGLFPGNLNTSTAPLLFANGFLYGVTQASRANQVYGSGIVFELSTGGAERVLYRFGNSPASDAYVPIDLLDVNGILYGTSLSDTSAPFAGSVYELGKAGERVLYAFKGTADGRSPNGGLIYRNGTLYGTTFSGGAYALGTVFTISGSTEKVLYSFKGMPDGAYPSAGGIIVNGVGYGTTTRGGAYDNGTIFRLMASGSETVLHSFQGGTDGANPSAGLMYSGGSLYGTTQNGGNGHCTGGCGTVFKLTL